jgi:hypothetical protein
LTVDRPARTVIMRLALSGTVVDMTENAEPEFRILVENLPLGHIITKMSDDEGLVSEDVLDEGANFLSAFGPRIVRQYAVTRGGELFESVPHQPTPSGGVMLQNPSLSS